MRRRIPVACSDIGPHREIGLDFPYFFDPYDADAAAEAIQASFGAPRSRIEGASEHSQQFTWDATAEATARIYDRVAAARA
jgi:glycosyltransferase involved in cell wall biosynthesis